MRPPTLPNGSRRGEADARSPKPVPPALREREHVAEGGRGDEAFVRAREHGARVVEEPTTWEYGERSGVVEDLGGHRWELTQTVCDVAPEEWGGVTVAPW